MANMSETINELALSLSASQAVLENVTRDKKGISYKYADLASCLSAIKEPLSSNGLAISQLLDKDEHGDPILITLLLHKSGQWIKSRFPLKIVSSKMNNEMQALGSAISYARRYALTAIIGLAQEDDDGGGGKHHQRDNRVTLDPKLQPLGDRAALLGKLKELCKINNIDLTAFARVLSLNSHDIPSLQETIENWDFQLERFHHMHHQDIPFKA